MRASTAPAATAWTRPARALLPLLDGLREVGLEGGKGSIEHFPARHDDEIQSWARLEHRSDLMAPEQLARQPFRAISTNRGSQFAAGGDPESRMLQRGRNGDERHEPRVNPAPL